MKHFKLNYASPLGVRQWNNENSDLAYRYTFHQRNMCRSDMLGQKSRLKTKICITLERLL